MLTSAQENEFPFTVIHTLKLRVSICRLPLQALCNSSHLILTTNFLLFPFDR